MKGSGFVSSKEKWWEKLHVIWTFLSVNNNTENTVNEVDRNVVLYQYSKVDLLCISVFFSVDDDDDEDEDDDAPFQ